MHYFLLLKILRLFRSLETAIKQTDDRIQHDPLFRTICDNLYSDQQLFHFLYPEFKQIYHSNLEVTSSSEKLQLLENDFADLDDFHFDFRFKQLLFLYIEKYQFSYKENEDQELIRLFASLVDCINFEESVVISKEFQSPQYAANFAELRED